MCEIKKSNFESELSSILARIDESVFIAVDTEFTGLRSNPGDKQSLFNGAEESYRLLRKNASQFIICELGLAVFVANPPTNSYDVYSYNFYIFPSSDGLYDSCFLMQVSCSQFLCEHKFDFNKWVYEGISYMNLEQEKELGLRLENLDFSNYSDENLNDGLLQKAISEVTRWLETVSDGDTMEVCYDRLLHPCFFHIALRRVFSNIWTTTNKENGKIIIEKIDEELRKQKEKVDHRLNEQVMESKLGFSKIFKHLQKVKKPLVGHNLLLDLLLMYNQFHKPLPRKLKDFKKSLLQLFPSIYDTKHIAYELRKEMKNKNVSVLFNLYDLYKELSRFESELSSFHSPSICLADGFESYEKEHLHEAGYDAYLAGYVFIRLAHFYACSKLKSSLVARPLSPAQHLNTVQVFCNRVNLIRARINFINLLHDDPVSHRPDWLVIESKKKIDLVNVTSFMSRFGSFDYRVLNDYSLVVATSNFRCFKDILNNFHQQKPSVYRVRKYSVLSHSPFVRTSFWIATSLIGGFGAILLFRAIKE